MSTFVHEEIESQPACWSRAAEIGSAGAAGLPEPGEAVAVVGCGTSWFMAMAYSSLREAAGQGRTDAFTASEMPTGRDYDRVLAITRSGTTTEVVRLLAESTGTPSTVITAATDGPALAAADQGIHLPFVDERSVVQTRFATSTLALLRAHLGESLERVVDDGGRALELDLQPYLDADQVTFLGSGWTIGLAHEAALKTREAAQFWAESYPAMDYRHGPISIAQPGRLVWSLGAGPTDLEQDVTATGATWVGHDLDPLAGLVVAQRFAVALAGRRGLDPDRPRHLTRAVVLDNA
ncbi:SIS domain-containing protein [Serinicoccus sp. LYQ131]|uniref:SIS domain-containing protein n=1 Tax=Serinicoccus sp. LYQ131 TaxID=3378797 RepID=UPI003852082B